jgi:hypothetical protein
MVEALTVCGDKPKVKLLQSTSLAFQNPRKKAVKQVKMRPARNPPDRNN